MTSPGAEHPTNHAATPMSPPPPYPPQPPYPPVPMYPAPPMHQQPLPKFGPATKKKSALPIILGVIGGFTLLVCGGGVLAAALGGTEKPAANVSHDDTTVREESAPQATTTPAAAAKTPAAKEPEPKLAKMNQAVRDGKFEFVVTKVKCGVAKVGDSFLSKTAQGQYRLVTTTVKNIGKEPQMFSDSGQKAFDAKGAEYATDEAGFYANKNGEVFLNNINPGNKVTAILVWDIPQGTKLTRVELHDSMFSGGVEVSLS